MGNLDLCNDDQKAEIEKFTALGAEELQKLVDEKQEAIDGAETTFKSELEALQKRYEELTKEKEATIEAASPDLRTMRTVLGSLTKGADAKDELYARFPCKGLLGSGVSPTHHTHTHAQKHKNTQKKHNTPCLRLCLCRALLACTDHTGTYEGLRLNFKFRSLDLCGAPRFDWFHIIGACRMPSGAVPAALRALARAPAW